MNAVGLGHLTFDEAAAQWIASRALVLSPRTVSDYRNRYIRALSRFFGAMQLDHIHIGHVTAYQKQRSADAGAYCLNHEISTLAQILTRAGMWTEIERFYEPLPLPRTGPGVALEPDEERHLFQVAKKNPRWLVAYCCSLVSNNTLAGPGEILHLRLRDIDLGRRTIFIRESLKNRHRERSLPLNDDALWAVQTLLERAARKGAVEPDHYLLPHRARKAGEPPDVSKPMGSYKKAWYSLREKAGEKYPRLKTLRRYDLRHSAATKMLENPEVSEPTVVELLGHRVNSPTWMIYSHIRRARKQQAAEALNGGYTRPDVPRIEDPPRAKPVRRAMSALEWRMLVARRIPRKFRY